MNFVRTILFSVFLTFIGQALYDLLGFEKSPTLKFSLLIVLSAGIAASLILDILKKKYFRIYTCILYDKCIIVGLCFEAWQKDKKPCPKKSFRQTVKR